jgi:hypothetical protein
VGRFDPSLRSGTLAVVSGRIAKQSPSAMKLQTPSAVLGVRGTEFVVSVGAFASVTPSLTTQTISPRVSCTVPGGTRNRRRRRGPARRRIVEQREARQHVGHHEIETDRRRGVAIDLVQEPRKPLARPGPAAERRDAFLVDLDDRHQQAGGTKSRRLRRRAGHKVISSPS